LVTIQDMVCLQGRLKQEYFQQCVGAK